MNNFPPPEVIKVDSLRIACDGSGDISPALGHPRVYLHIDDNGYVDCGYCDRRFVLANGPAAHMLDRSDGAGIEDGPATDAPGA